MNTWVVIPFYNLTSSFYTFLSARSNFSNWVLQKRNSEILLERIKYVIGLSQGEKDKIAQQAIRRVRTDFNIPKQQEAFVEFYTN